MKQICDCTGNFHFDYEPNGILFDLKSKRKLSQRTYYLSIWKESKLYFSLCTKCDFWNWVANDIFKYCLFWSQLNVNSNIFPLSRIWQNIWWLKNILPFDKNRKGYCHHARSYWLISIWFILIWLIFNHPFWLVCKSLYKIVKVVLKLTQSQFKWFMSQLTRPSKVTKLGFPI